MSITSHSKPKTKFEVFKDLVDKFEEAVRAHEMRNSQRPEDRVPLDARLLSTRIDLQAWYAVTSIHEQATLAPKDS